MKESEFIELLNLYLDHEIAPNDAVRLEAEVQGNPARRKVYQSYCRMQKACRILATDFGGDSSGVAIAGEAKIVEFRPAAAVSSATRRSHATGFLAVGAFAALAACVAIIFVSRGRHAPLGTTATVQTIPLRGTNPALATTPSATRGGLVSIARVPTQNSRLSTTLVSDPLLLTGNSQADAMRSAAAQQANDQLAWINNLQLAPLQQRVSAEELRFDVIPATMRPEGRPLGGSRGPAEATVEMTAFSFVK